MKRLNLPFLILIIASASYCACTKKASAPPVVKSTTVVDSPKISIGSPVRPNLYPYTDTFTGTLNVTFIYDSYSGLDTTHDAYQFYVTHLNDQVLIFDCSVKERVMNNWLYVLTDKPDTGILDANNQFKGTLFVYNNFKFKDTYDQSLQTVYSLQNNGTTLTVSWDNPYFPVPGTCDYGESKGQYTGTRK